jgi:hypothetical protein
MGEVPQDPLAVDGTPSRLRASQVAGSLSSFTATYPADGRAGEGSRVIAPITLITGVRWRSGGDQKKDLGMGLG